MSSKVWFSADIHFGHKWIIFLCKRPFKSVKEMDETIIRNWNKRVGKDDFVIFLGDFAYKSAIQPKNYISRLNGHIVFVQGNHDLNLGSPIQHLIINTMQEDIYCVHDPKDFSSAYSLNLVGHVHQNWKVKKIYETFLVNVGVDCWGFSPVSIEEILKAKYDFEKEWQKKWKRKYGKKKFLSTCS